MSKNISLRELRRLVNKIRNISFRYKVAVQLKTDPDLYNGSGGAAYTYDERLPKYFSGGKYVYYADQGSNWIDEDNVQGLPSAFRQVNKNFSHPSQPSDSVKITQVATITLNQADGDKVSSASLPAGTYRFTYLGQGAIKYRSDGRASAGCDIIYNGGILSFRPGTRNPWEKVVSDLTGAISATFYHQGGVIKIKFNDSDYSDNSVKNGGSLYAIEQVEEILAVGSEKLEFEQDVSVDSRINSGIYIPYYVNPSQRVTIQYISGTWRSDYNNLYVNPDISGAIGKYEPFKPCIVSIPGLDMEAIYNSSSTPIEYFPNDYGFINLRMADHDGQREDNDGIVTYKIKVYSTVKAAPSIKTYVTSRSFRFYSPIQVQETESIISGNYPKTIIKGEVPISDNVIDDDNAGRGNVAVNLNEAGLNGEILWNGDEGAHPKQANMYAVKNEDFLYLNNLLYTMARRVELIEDFDYDDLSNQASKGAKVEQAHFDSMVRVANKILEILDNKESWFDSNDICSHTCQISCQTGCLVACQSCNNGQCHDQKCGAH